MIKIYECEDRFKDNKCFICVGKYMCNKYRYVYDEYFINTYDNYTYNIIKDEEYNHEMKLKDLPIHTFGIENTKNVYEGWEIIKLLSEGKLKEGTKLINNNNCVYEVRYDGESYYIKNEEEWDVSVSYFTNDTHFRILVEE